MNHKPLRILQTPVRYIPYVGGVEKYVFDLSNHLAKQNHSVIVVCANEPKAPNENGSVSVRRLPYIGKIANTNITPTLFFKLLKTRFDIIHTHIPTPWSADISMLVSWLKRKPLIVTYHNDLVNNGPSRALLFLYNHTLLKLILNRAAVIIITQPHYLETSEHLQNYKHKIQVIPNGFDTSSLTEQNVARDPNTIFLLSSLDKYHRYKGVDTLIKAVGQVKTKNPNIKLLIGGSGELADEYKKMTKELGLESNISFLGRIDEKDKNKYYQSASAFVLPSNSREEGFGIVLLEAMANGTPVITTKYAGVKDDIQANQAGYVVPENDPAALAEKIGTITTNASLVKEMGAHGRKLVFEKYTWDKIAERISEIYSNVI